MITVSSITKNTDTRGEQKNKVTKSMLQGDPPLSVRLKLAPLSTGPPR